MDQPGFNLFRRRVSPDLVCAVPESQPVPGFIEGDQWEFGGKVTLCSAPAGFDDTAAEAGVRFNGFYIFQLLGAQPSTPL